MIIRTRLLSTFFPRLSSYHLKPRPAAAYPSELHLAKSQVVKLLKVGGKVNVAFRGDDAATVKRALTFAGFLKVAPCPEDGRVLAGERAAWETGASAPVRLSFAKPAAAAAAAVKNGSLNVALASNGNGAPAKNTWKLALDDDDDDEGGMGGGEDDLVDEDALLESSAPVKRASEAVSV